MPITGPTSYVSTTEEVISHWGVANATLGPGNEVVLQGNVTLPNLQTLLDSLVAKRLDLTAKLNIQETARGEIEIRKAALLLRINQFNDVVRADFAGTKWELALSNVPSIGDGQGVFVPPLEDASTLWSQLNAGIAPAPPVALLGGYTQALFAAEIVALNAAYTAWRAAIKIAEITLAERNDIQDLIHPQLLSYRKKLPTKFAKNHALVDTLPALSLPPGSTPDPVVVQAIWNPATGLAEITWNASLDADLYQFEIRFCAGPIYDTDLESVIGNVFEEAPRQFFTAAGLATAGSVASYKVYVMTNTGHEKGSNAVSVLHAVPPPPNPSP